MVNIREKHKQILSKNLLRGDKFKVDDILLKWQEPWRYYHNLDHLFDLLNEIEYSYQSKKINEVEYEQLILIAFFHDIVYKPNEGFGFNEDQSSKFYIYSISQKVNDFDWVIINAINDTISHIPNGRVSEIFCELDMKIIFQSTFEDLILYGKKIFKEYQFVSFDIFKEHHIKFISGYQDKNENIKHYIEYLESWVPNVGIYAGSFNPIHIGHLDIIQKASEIFDKVIIAKGFNPEKEPDNSFSILKQKLPFYQVSQYKDFLSYFIKEQEDLDQNITLIRGIRDSKDLDYELKTIRFIKDQKPDLKVVFIPSDEKYNHISSSDIRSIQKISPEAANKYLI